MDGCVHRRRIETPDGRAEIRGACIYCGDVRLYSPAIAETDPFRDPLPGSATGFARQKRAAKAAGR